MTLFGDPIRDIGMPREALQLTPQQKNLILENVYTKKVKFYDNRAMDKKIRLEISKSFRNAQNYPIQSPSSTLAALGAYYILQYIRANEMTARIDCFTHDSIDMDAQIADLPTIISVLPKYAITELVNEFGLPIKTDFEIGISGDEPVELKKTHVEGNILTAEFHDSKQTALQKIEKRFTKFGVKCDITVEKTEDNLRSMGELFATKGAFSLSIGQHRTLLSGKLSFDFSNVRRHDNGK